MTFQFLVLLTSLERYGIFPSGKDFLTARNAVNGISFNSLSQRKKRIRIGLVIEEMKEKGLIKIADSREPAERVIALTSQGNSVVRSGIGSFTKNNPQLSLFTDGQFDWINKRRVDKGGMAVSFIRSAIVTLLAGILLIPAAVSYLFSPGIKET